MSGVLVDPAVNIPVLIEQGDSVSWVDNPFTDIDGDVYNATVYALTYTLAGATAPLTIAAVPTGANWTTTITPAQSAGLTPGKYWWQVAMSSTALSYQFTVARGDLTVVANLALQAAGYSGLSPAEQNLAAAQAQLATATSTESYKIATREMKYRMIADIVAGISYWNAVVVNERTINSIRQNQGNPRKMYARFPGGTSGGWF